MKIKTETILLFLLLIILFPGFVIAQPYKLRFNHLTIQDGLTNNSVSHIFQDSKAFLWISTQDGFNRYDGYYFKHYKHIPGNLNSLSDYAVNHIFEDSNGFFWISTREGLNLFDPETEKFIHFNPDSSNPNSLSSEKIVQVVEAKDGKIWIATRNGLNVYDPLKKEFKAYLKNDSELNSLSSNKVTSICFDSRGTLWVGTLNGLNRFNPNTNSFEVFLSDEKDSKSISGNAIGYVFEDSKKNLWIATNRGLSKLRIADDSSVQFENYFHNPGDVYSISPNRIRVIDEDSKGKLWIGTIGGGLNIYDPETNRFTQYKHSPDDVYSISNDEIFTICVDNYDNVWIGTVNNGISKYSPTYERFKIFQPDPFPRSNTKANDISAIMVDNQNKLWLGKTSAGVKIYDSSSLSNHNPLFELKSETNTGLSSNKISAILLDKDGMIWIGTFGNGLNRYNPLTKKIDVFNYQSDNPASLSNKYVHSVFQDSEGIIWIGTGLGGVNKLDKNTNSFKRYSSNPQLQNHPKYLNSSEVVSICEDSKGFMWFGTTTGGLSRFDKKTETFTHYKHIHTDDKSISSNRIVCIYEDKQKRLWIGTFSGGLNLFNEKTNSFNHYLEKDGLPDNTVQAITEDEKGYLWLTTNKGISRFNPEKKEFKNFDRSDGLLIEEFNPRSVYKDIKSGIIYFGSANGLNIYNPNSIVDKTETANVILTDFKLFNVSVKPEEKSPIKKSIAFAEEINLSHDQDVISFSFASLDLTSPDKNQYAYKLEGFDKDWIYSGNHNEVTYNNLNPGEYIFKVKATNSDGVWNDNATQIKLIINPPFWRTWWATIFYILVAAIGLYAIRKYEMSRIKLRNNLKLKEFESQKLQEVDQIKSRFFANLSHEFRTPLMLIKGPVEQLRTQISDSDINSKLNMVSRNIHNLQTLIDQLLELSQLEASAIPVKAKKQNIVTVLKGLAYSFESIARQRNIDLSFTTELTRLDVWFDTDKLEKVINNLLSNAVKFTKAGGSISVLLNITADDDKEFTQITVVDTGIGIDENKIDKIFDRFYQTDDSPNKNFAGSGIGLALVKELVDLHKWIISVKSKLNVGTEFTLKIPLWDYLDDSQKIIEAPQITSGNDLDLEFEPISSNREIDKKEENSKQNKQRPLILIVEDSEDVRIYLKDLLKNDYNILEAENGVNGLESAAQNSPDLIISDIMMPSMDGIEFCRRIKTNWESSHIPVILLTAKVSSESKFEGLETGADDYLTKPFESRELFARIKNLLEQRKRLKEKFAKEIRITADAITTNSVDNEFLTKAFDVIEKNISNPDFTAEDLAKELFMSLSQLRRKLIALTGESPGEFLRAYKLKRAARLILEKNLSITQIAFEVGFHSPSHFTKAFQQQFNCPPSEFTDKTIQSS